MLSDKSTSAKIGKKSDNEPKKQKNHSPSPSFHAAMARSNPTPYLNIGLPVEGGKGDYGLAAKETKAIYMAQILCNPQGYTLLCLLAFHEL